MIRALNVRSLLHGGEGLYIYIYIYIYQPTYLTNAVPNLIYFLLKSR